LSKENVRLDAPLIAAPTGQPAAGSEGRFRVPDLAPVPNGPLIRFLEEE
jgi:hypothetical protein